MNIEKKIDAAIAKIGQAGSIEADLMKQPHYRRDLWESYGPGKYDDWATAYVDEIAGHGGAGDEIGDVETTNAYTSIEGPFDHPSLKGHAGAILEYTNQGFVHSEFFKSKKALEKKWKSIEKYVEENTPDEEY